MVVEPLQRQRQLISTIWPTPTAQAIQSAPEFFKKYVKIKSSEQPNYVAARLQVDSDLNLDAWDAALVNYHDQELCGFLRYGWPVGYHRSVPPTTTEDNHHSAHAHMSHVQQFITKELGFGAILGPFDDPPFVPWMRSSPVMTRPKKESTERRVIVDLTFPLGEGVNAGIDIKDYFGKDVTYTLPSIGDLVTKLQLLGRGAYIWKADLARAYRQLRVDPLDTPLLGMRVEGKYYLDLCPSFGCKTSSAACQRLSNAVVYIMARANHFTLAYLDDYAGCGADEPSAVASYNYFRETASRLGLALAQHKCVPPTQIITWLGYLIDTTSMTVAVPQTKLDEVLQLCRSWMGKKRANLRMVQSLAGRLLYVANCIIPARRFMARILATLRSLDTKKWVTLTCEFKLDLQWFLSYASLANGRFYYTPSRRECEIECDSSLLAGGGVAGTHYYSWLYSSDHTSTYDHIHHLEAINLLVAYRTLAPLVAHPGDLVVLSTDNMASRPDVLGTLSSPNALERCGSSPESTITMLRSDISMGP